MHSLLHVPGRLFGMLGRSIVDPLESLQEESAPTHDADVTTDDVTVTIVTIVCSTESSIKSRVSRAA